MRKRLPALLLALLLSLLAGCGAAPGGAGGPEGRVITDMAGRTVTVPEEIASPFPRTPRRGSISTPWFQTGCWGGTTP